MKYFIMHKYQEHVLFAICSSRESAEKWISQFNPLMWMDKTLKKEDLIIVEKSRC